MRLLGFVCAAALAVADPYRFGLANSRGLFAGKSGLYAAEAGNGAAYGDASTCALGAEGPGCLGNSGRITIWPYDENLESSWNVASGIPSFAALNTSGNALGVHDVHVDAEGVWYIIGGVPLAGAMGPSVVINAEISCKLYLQNNSGTFVVADFFAYEDVHDVDGQGFDCDPYRFERAADGSFVVADAAANAIYRAWVDGSIETIAVWANVMGLPGAPPNGAQPVPTGIALGKDGEIYVGNFLGFPFTTGESTVRKYSADGSFEVIATGFTSLTDLAVDKQGNVWVLEMSPSVLSLSSGVVTGTLTRIDRKTWATTKYLNNGELILANGLAIDVWGDFYIGSNTLGGNDFLPCPAACENNGFLIKWTPPSFPDNEPSEKGTVINFNFAGLFSGINNGPARK